MWQKKRRDQLRGYHKADLHLCFRQCNLLVFPGSGLYIIYVHCYAFIGQRNPSCVHPVVFGTVYGLSILSPNNPDTPRTFHYFSQGRENIYMPTCLIE